MTTPAPTTVPPTSLAPTTVASTTSVPTTLAPTTLIGSTVAPTTLVGSTAVPTTTLTTAPPTTAGPSTVPPTTPEPIEIECDPLEITISITHLLSRYPSADRDPTLDYTRHADPLEITLELLGDINGLQVGASPLEIEISIHGTFIEGVGISDCVLETTIELAPANFTVESVPLNFGPKSNFVKWSKIGDLDFTIDESNVAGERPMDWQGWVYGIKKLKNSVVVYGSNGVSIMKPTGINWGLETIYSMGIKGKGAVVGTNFLHHFIDVEGRLFELGEKLTKLDYSEFLSQMTNPIMSLDIEKDLIYICDDTYGYVYSITDKSFGEAPINITGIGSQNNTLYVVGSGEIENRKFEICTDIYDVGTRLNKTLEYIEIGTDLNEFLEASADFRTHNNQEFQQIPWVRVNPDGRAFPKCFGVEFRIRLRSYKYEYFEVDYIKLFGVIHNFSSLDYSSYAQHRF